MIHVKTKLENIHYHIGYNVIAFKSYKYQVDIF